MLHSKFIFKSMTGPDDTYQVDLWAWMSKPNSIFKSYLKVFCLENSTSLDSLQKFDRAPGTHNFEPCLFVLYFGYVILILIYLFYYSKGPEEPGYHTLKILKTAKYDIEEMRKQEKKLPPSDGKSSDQHSSYTACSGKWIISEITKK